MNILIHRKYFSHSNTIGELFINDKWECFTLEDTVREGEKIPGKTAIPKGKYAVVIDMSVRFKRLMPHVLDVPGFSGIRIHSGNTDADTEGCILVGQTHGVSSLGDSRLAFAALFEKIKDALGKGETVNLEVV
jgi:hypothetical protein